MEREDKKERLLKDLAVQLHRLEWDEIAKRELISKKDCSIWKHNGGTIEMAEIANECFLCEYVQQKTGRKPGRYTEIELCEHCPIEWPTGTCFGQLGSLFTRWIATKSPYIADRISSLPCKEEEKPLEPADPKIFILAKDGKGNEIRTKKLYIYLSPSEGLNYEGDGDISGSKLAIIDLHEKRFLVCRNVNKAARRVSGLRFNAKGEVITE